jgi:myo-inositol-1(or 4)-monophosphatase
VIGTGIPHKGRPNHDRFLKELRAVMGASAGVRRMGSAALDLAWTAAGRLDGFWEHGLRAWDLAAGIVILREAGAYVSDDEGKDRMLENGGIVAGNETVHAKLLKLLKAAGSAGAAAEPAAKAALPR